MIPTSDDEWFRIQKDQVRRQMTRPTFQHIMYQAKYCPLRYLSFEEVREKQRLIVEASPLKAVF
jgi:hypothetical protein